MFFKDAFPISGKEDGCFSVVLCVHQGRTPSGPVEAAIWRTFAWCVSEHWLSIGCYETRLSCRFIVIRFALFEFRVLRRSGEFPLCAQVELGSLRGARIECPEALRIFSWNEFHYTEDGSDSKRRAFL